MKLEERLFRAIGEVDEALLARSERRVRSHYWVAWAALGGLTVCAALLWAFLPKGNIPVEEPPAPEAVSLRLDGGDVGDFHLCTAGQSGFVLYVNEDMYRCREEDGVYLVEPLVYSGELPLCRLEIVRQAHTAPRYAAELAAAELAESYAEVSVIAEDTAIDALTVSGSDGISWDAAQADVYVVSDGEGGAYVLTARYFMEATEGHGARFRDMLGTFEALTPETSGPVWLTELRETASQLIPAVFAGDLASVRDLLAENAEICGAVEYPEDVTVSSIDYTTDDDDPPTSAVVSVRYRSGTEDSYNHLTLELLRTEDRWLASFAGIEK